MNIHFHYYCINVLAQTAGFSATEAETMAYASQYVDDATEGRSMRVENPPPEAEDQHISGLFEPIRTAHIGLDYGDHDVQRKVYIAFHFLPGEPYTGGEYDYRVVPDGNLPQLLLQEGLRALRTAGADAAARTRALIKTGIALHTYADTWSHQRFSGRHNSGDNDIQNRERFENGEWRALGLFERAALDIAPDVGHAEAATMPDASHLHWRYTRASGGPVIDRDNTTEFTNAAATILARLCSVTGAAPNLPQEIRPTLAQHTDSHALWCANFPKLTIARYDACAWRSSALTGGHVHWDKFTRSEQFLAQTYRYNGDPRWFIFHSEAGKQRDFVLRRIRFDLE